MIQYKDRLLEAINFNFAVTHPYHILLQLGRLFRESEQDILLAYQCMQRVYMTSIILHYPPHYLALVALLEAKAGKSMKAELGWAEQNAINKVDLADIQDKLKQFWSSIKSVA